MNVCGVMTFDPQRNYRVFECRDYLRLWSTDLHQVAIRARVTSALDECGDRAHVPKLQDELACWINVHPICLRHHAEYLDMRHGCFSVTLVGFKAVALGGLADSPCF